VKIKIVAAFLLAVFIVSGSFAKDSSTRSSKKSDSDFFEITGLSLGFSSTPLGRYDNISNNNSSGVRNRWVVMDCAFKPLKPNGSNNAWFDDVSMEGILVIGSEDANGQRQYIVLNGRTRFFTIPADGKVHLGMFFVPPRLLDRYYVATKAYSLKMFIGARISFYGPGRVLLGEGFWYNGKFVKKDNERIKAKNFMAQFDKKFRDVVQLRGGLFSKEKTPWAHINYDSYDLIYEEITDGEATQGIVK